jgi:MFS family permease
MSEASLTTLQRPPLAIWIVVVAGPALRSSLLGCLLVIEEAIGKAFALGAGTLAVLVESVIFGGLLAVFLAPPLVAGAGLHRVSQISVAATILVLAIGVSFAPLMSAGTLATMALFLAAVLLGFFCSVLSPTTQTLLNNATSANAPLRKSLQSMWAAGQPVGFVLAATAGGVLTERIAWWAALLVPLGFALVLGVALLDRETTRVSVRAEAHAKPAIVEIIWIVIALTAFQVWSTWGGLTSWFTPGVMAALIVTGLTIIVATRQLERSTRPAISPAPFSIAGFAPAALILFLIQLPTTAEFEILLLTELVHMPAAEIGYRTAIGNLAQIAGTAAAAAMLLRHQVGPALFVGLALMIVGLGGYVLYPWWHGFAPAVFARAVTGFGSGLLMPCLFVIALNRMPAPLQIAAGAWLVLAVIGGTEIGLALFDIVLEVTIGIARSAFAGYLAVEIAQVAVGTATAILAARLTMRGMLSLAGAAVPAPTGGSAQA